MVSKQPTRAMRPLTTREQQVLQLMAHGLTSKESGKRLGISQRTVETHRVAIYRKTHMTSMAELLRWAIITKKVTLPKKEGTS